MALWTPAEVTTALWLDATDSDTITTVSGGVSEWRDKSGNLRHASQATQAQRPPVTTDALNSLPVVTFSTHKLSLGDALRTVIGGATKLMILAVMRMTATSSPDGQRLIQFEANTVGDSAYVMLLGGEDNYALTSAVYDGTYQTAAHTTSSEWRLVCLEYVGGTALRAYDFDVQTSADASVGTTISTPAAGSLTMIGATGRSSPSTTIRYLKGDIAELLLITGDVSERQRLAGYLAWKWGLQANLPGDHTYKDAAPTIASTGTPVSTSYDTRFSLSTSRLLSHDTKAAIRTYMQYQADTMAAVRQAVQSLVDSAVVVSRSVSGDYDTRVAVSEQTQVSVDFDTMASISRAVDFDADTRTGVSRGLSLATDTRVVITTDQSVSIPFDSLVQVSRELSSVTDAQVAISRGMISVADIKSAISNEVVTAADTVLCISSCSIIMVPFDTLVQVSNEQGFSADTCVLVMTTAGWQKVIVNPQLLNITPKRSIVRA